MGRRNDWTMEMKRGRGREVEVTGTGRWWGKTELGGDGRGSEVEGKQRSGVA